MTSTTPALGGVRARRENADHLVAALADFGFGSLGLTRADFLTDDAVVQLGHPPKRIDIVTRIDGVEFEDCWDRRVEIGVGHQAAPFIASEDLIVNKKASGRPQDLADVAMLERDAGAD